MLSLVCARIIVMLSLMVCLSWVSQNCNVYRIRLPWILTTSILCRNHYTNDIPQEKTNVRILRSTVSKQLPIPRSRLKGFRSCAFSIAAPRLWNALPGSITERKYTGAFKNVLRHSYLNLPLTRWKRCSYIFCHAKHLTTNCWIGRCSVEHYLDHIARCSFIHLSELGQCTMEERGQRCLTYFTLRYWTFKRYIFTL